MGTWDFGPFDNDVAADWVDEMNGLDSDEAREAAAWRALSDVFEMGRAPEDEGDIALAAAAWITASVMGTRYPGSPEADPPRLTSQLRQALENAVYGALLQPDSRWMSRQREGGPAALEAVYAINAALGSPPPLGVEPHYATVTPVVNVELPWSRQDPRFRVYFFSRDAEVGWRVRADDITDGEMTDAWMHAEQNFVDGEWFAIALIVDGPRDGPGQVWLMGKDPRDPIVSDDDRMRIRRMGGRSAFDDGSSGAIDHEASGD